MRNENKKSFAVSSLTGIQVSFFNGKFRQIFIELSNFKEEEDECENDFEQLEKLVSKANMAQEKRMQYAEEWKVYNDYFNTLDFAEQKGMQKGIRETAHKLKELGVADDIIIKSTGISKEEIEKL